MISRRHLIALSASTLVLGAADTAPALRLGILPFGSVHWVSDVMQRHGLDRAHGFALQTQKLANSDASRVALTAHSVDVAVNDWPYVVASRARGTRLCFAPFSSSLGGIMVPAESRIKTLADLKGVRFGVAGGPADKSWLIVQAAARRQGIDLQKQATLSFGSPPLLGGLLQKGALDAVLTFWTNAARLEAAGCHEAISVGDCAVQVGLPAKLDLVGYVFDEDWASAHRPVINGFLAASKAAMELLRTNDAEWQAVRPQMDAPDDRLFAALRRRFVEGIGQPSAQEETRQATLVTQAIGGPKLFAVTSYQPWTTSLAFSEPA